MISKKNATDSPYGPSVLSKSSTFYWLNDKDTLDFKVELREYKEKGNVSLTVSHQNRMSFADC